MPCMFLYSCNEKISRCYYDYFCKSKRHLDCDIYRGTLDKKRPSEWVQSSTPKRETP